MRRIRIKNFGPIRSGLAEHESWMDIRKVTLFIGDNGTGKSAIAKMISTLSWMEKALFQRRLTQRDDLSRLNILEEYARYHKIENYFGPNTEIDYEGDAYRLSYRDERMTSRVMPGKDMGYHIPKIMYVGSERNFLSVASNPDKIPGLPASLGTFWDEFRAALEKLSGRLALPVDGVELSYGHQTETAYIHGTDNQYRIRLSEASSGIQSVAPLFVVSRYLSQSLREKSDKFTRKRSSEEERALEQEVDKILNTPGLSEDVRKIMLNKAAERYSITGFQNIVEEPEQNLFPDSQRKMLNALLEFTNSTAANELLITTHSPYLVSYISLAIKAAKVIKQLKTKNPDEALISKVSEIVPLISAINPENVIIYEIKKNGTIKELETEGGIPTDENDLNERLMQINELFSDLINIRQKA